jgi:DNA-binding LacI/PurR family transcriptional regulator/DNA-binding transcriptional regulator YhcF (GntR family)
VIRTVNDWLESGRLRPGEPLPSARAIAAQLEIDPRTVGVALSILEKDGKIRQRSNGRRIVSPRATANDSFLSNAVVMISGQPLLDPASTFVQSGWSMQLELAARAGIQRNNHHFVVVNLAQMHEQLERLMRDRPIGVIVADPEHVKGDLMSLLHESAAKGLNVVVYGDTAHYEAFDRVVSDHAAGSRDLTHWLIGRGRRRPVLLLPAGMSQRPWVEGRIAGYRAACDEAGIQPLPPIELPKLDERWGNGELFAHKSRVIAGYLATALTAGAAADALLAPSDGTTFAIAAACRLLNRRVHDDVTIVGYDNYWEGSPERRLVPFTPAATVDKRNDRIGRTLVELLSERAAGKLPEGPQCRVIEPEMIINASDQHGLVGSLCVEESSSMEESKP